MDVWFIFFKWMSGFFWFFFYPYFEGEFIKNELSYMLVRFTRIVMRYFFILFTFALSTAPVKASEFEYKHLALGKWEITDTNYCPNVCAQQLYWTSCHNYSGVITQPNSHPAH